MATADGDRKSWQKMTEEEKRLRDIAAEEMRTYPQERVISFYHEGKKYWIKKKQGNGRNRWVKASESHQFYYEAAHMMMAARLVPYVPDMVFLTDACMVLRDAGYTAAEWLRGGAGDGEKRHILYEAGAALARLHKAGLFHGRPALRDMTWNGKNLVFLDWENRPFFKDLQSRQCMDVILFFQGMYRESWMQERWTESALAGYAAAGGDEMLQKVCAFLQRYAWIGWLCAALHPFHFKDVEALSTVYQWLPARQMAIFSASTGQE